MGAATNSTNGGRNGITNNSNPNPNNGGGGRNANQNKKKEWGGKGYGKNNITHKQNGFRGTQTEDVMNNITLSTNKTIQLPGQFKKFKEAAQAYANRNGMSNIANCIKDLVDKDNEFFKAEVVDLLDCINNVMVQQKDADDNVLTDSKGKILGLTIEKCFLTFNAVVLFCIFPT